MHYHAEIVFFRQGSCDHTETRRRGSKCFGLKHFFLGNNHHITIKKKREQFSCVGGWVLSKGISLLIVLFFIIIKKKKKETVCYVGLLVSGWYFHLKAQGSITEHVSHTRVPTPLVVLPLSTYYYLFIHKSS